MKTSERLRGAPSALKAIVRNSIRRIGWDLVRYAEPKPLPNLPDLPEDEARIVTQVLPFTLTSPERIAALIHAVKYITKYRIPGDIVECGVHRGGSMMAAALTLLTLGDSSRQLYLYDTFDRMPPPTDIDVDVGGRSAKSHIGVGIWWAPSVEEAKTNLYSTCYPREHLHFVQGRVEATIPATVPRRISLLRLDTDWYESTKHELEHLYPLLVPHGIAIVDDYGHWQGARRAVDEYFAASEEPIFLNRIDFTGRLIIRCGR